MIRGGRGLSPEPDWGVRGQASLEQGGQNRYCTPVDPGYPLCHHLAPMPPRATKGDQDATAIRPDSHRPGLRALRPERIARPAAAPCTDGQRGGRAGAGTPDGRLDRQSVWRLLSQGCCSQLQPSFLSWCFLAPPCCCRGNLEQPVPMEPPLGRSRAHTARSNTLGHKRSHEAPRARTARHPNSTLGAPTKVAPATGDLPPPPGTGAPCPPGPGPREAPPTGAWGPQSSRADMTPAPQPRGGQQCPPSPHSPLLAQEALSTDTQLCLTLGPPGKPRRALNPTLLRVAPTAPSLERGPQLMHTSRKAGVGHTCRPQAPARVRLNQTCHWPRGTHAFTRAHWILVRGGAPAEAGLHLTSPGSSPLCPRPSRTSRRPLR